MRVWFSAGISKWTTGFIFIFLPPDILRIDELWWVEAAVVGPASCECIIASRLAAKQGFVAAGRNTVLAWARRARRSRSRRAARTARPCASGERGEGGQMRMTRT